MTKTALISKVSNNWKSTLPKFFKQADPVSCWILSMKSSPRNEPLKFTLATTNAHLGRWLTSSLHYIQTTQHESILKKKDHGFFSFSHTLVSNGDLGHWMRKLNRDGGVRTPTFLELFLKQLITPLQEVSWSTKKKMIVRGWNVNYHGTVNSNDFQQLLKSEQRLDGRIRNDDN